MHVDSLDAVSAGPARGVNHHLLHKLPQNCRGQFSGFGVLLHDFQKALNIDGPDFGGIYDRLEVFNRLFQVRLFLLVAFGQLRKPLGVQLAYNVVLRELLSRVSLKKVLLFVQYILRFYTVHRNVYLSALIIFADMVYFPHI